MLSYRELCELHGAPPPAPANPADEPTVLGPLLQVSVEPYPRWLQDALAQYARLRTVTPQLLRGFLLALWWERGRQFPTINQPGRYRRSLD